MASRMSYQLRISGRFQGPPSQLPTHLTSQIDALFAPPDRAGGTAPPGMRSESQMYDDLVDIGPGWPGGFWLAGHDLCEWTAPGDLYERDADGNVLVTFQTEFHHAQRGTLYDNYLTFVPTLAWFHSYRDYKWHMELTQGLQQINETAHAAGMLVEPLWFRAYQIYAGNGGP